MNRNDFEREWNETDIILAQRHPFYCEDSDNDRLADEGDMSEGKGD